MRIMSSSTTTEKVVIEKLCSLCNKKGHWAKEYVEYEQI